MKQAELIENHLEFLRTHRGAMRRLDDWALVESEKPMFTLAYQISGEAKLADLPTGMEQLYVLDSDARLRAEVEADGFVVAGSITHMYLDGELSTDHDSEESITIDEASDAETIEVFCETQTRGFFSDEEDVRQWLPFFLKAGLSNVANTSQRFLVGYVDGKPAGVTLSIVTGETVGIYAVATRPEYRKRGVATALLELVVAMEGGGRTVCLQVLSDTYAQKLYEQLGFTEAFRLMIYKRSK